ncbi:MAG: hypothetical protein LRZ84_07700, partial [Desertifilum sp.]|nr:hypothetical protein [Desertifilum sp.]
MTPLRLHHNPKIDRSALVVRAFSQASAVALNSSATQQPLSAGAPKPPDLNQKHPSSSVFSLWKVGREIWGKKGIGSWELGVGEEEDGGWGEWGDGGKK